LILSSILAAQFAQPNPSKTNSFLLLVLTTTPPINTNIDS
jgi:hypothetical protein